MSIKRKVFVAIIGIIVCVICVIAIKNYNENNVTIKVNQDTFRFAHETHHQGNRWNLHINSNQIVRCYFTPWDGATKDEMKEILCECIVTLYSDDEIRVYGITDSLGLDMYDGEYPVIYTLDGKEFFMWNADVRNSDENRREQVEILYEYISKSDLLWFSVQHKIP